MDLRDISYGGTRVPWNSLELSDISFGGTKVPWNSMEHSMEFHGKHASLEMAPSNFQMIFLFGDYRVPWNFMEYPMEVQDNMVLKKMRISKFHRIPYTYLMIFHLAAPFLNGIPWNIPWNSMEQLCHLKWRPPNSMESVGTRRVL